MGKTIFDDCGLNVRAYTGPGGEPMIQIYMYGSGKLTHAVARRLVEALAKSLAPSGVDAETEVVTADGVTRLPERMRQDLGVESGGMVWFLKDERDRWTAWKTAELDEMFGLSAHNGKVD